MRFKKGDHIVITSDNTYNYTGYGSKGFVVERSEEPDYYVVKFYKTSKKGHEGEYVIYAKHMGLIEGAHGGKYAAVCHKITEMYEKRKEQGYAF